MYTDRLNTKIILPSGNWFDSFAVNAKAKTVRFSYRDRRRNGQIARRYKVFFGDDLRVVDIIAISVQGSRVEHFGSCRAERYCRELLLEALEGTDGDTVVDEKPSYKWVNPIMLFMLFSIYSILLISLPFLVNAFDNS